MTKINVICGGESLEREVSLRSGKSVAKALADAGHAVQLIDPVAASIEEIIACDVVFPVLHGVGGEDGILQAELERLGAKYVGSASEASGLCFDKWRYRELVTRYDIPMPKASLVKLTNYAKDGLAKKPHVLKPITGGSSIDTFIVRDPAKAPHDAIEDTFRRYPQMLNEEFIDGAELTVGVLGDEALPIIEIIPPEGGEFDYKNKYNGASQEIVTPNDLNSDIQQAAQELALKAHQLVGCRDFSRTDIMCDKHNNMFLLETNTIPGMTDQSLYPRMAAAVGLSMPELCSMLVKMSLARG